MFNLVYEGNLVEVLLFIIELKIKFLYDGLEFFYIVIYFLFVNFSNIKKEIFYFLVCMVI